MRTQRTILVLLTAIAMLFTSLLVLQPTAPTRAQAVRPVLAFYYAWFDANTWSLPLSDHPRAPYISADPLTIETHVLLAKQAGIDALVLNWYGPPVENNQTETNFRILLEKAAIHGLKASLTVDIAGPFINNVNDLTNALLVARDQHAPNAAFLRVDGKPVIFFWRQNFYSIETWKTLRQQLDPNHTMLWIAEGVHPEALQVFDGLYLYSVAWSADPATVLVRWGDEVRNWARSLGARRYWVATVMPGYNDLATGRSNAFVRERADGAYYRATWNGAMQSDADWVVITSFNEWVEGTHIEPSQSYGDTYLNLTRDLAQQYRQMRPPTPTATPEAPTVTLTAAALEPTSTPLPPPTETPEPTPTVTLTPTATLPPTATPIRLPTPTPRPAEDPATTESPMTTAPISAEPPQDASSWTTPAAAPQRYAVEGGTARRKMPPLFIGMLILALGLIGVPLYRWWRSQQAL